MPLTGSRSEHDRLATADAAEPGARGAPVTFPGAKARTAWLKLWLLLIAAGALIFAVTASAREPLAIASSDFRVRPVHPFAPADDHP